MASPYDMPDLASLLGGNDPNQLATLAQALRARQLAGIGALSGNKGVMASAQGLEQGANQDLSREFQRGQTAPHLALQQEELRKDQEQRAALNHPAYAAGMQTFLKSMNPEMAASVEGAPPHVLQGVAALAEKKYAADQAHQARMTQARAMLQQSNVGLSPQALEMAAQLYARTGQLPNLGNRAVGAKAQIMENAARTNPGTDIASNKAILHGDSTSFANLQKQSDSVNAFERTALANLDQFLGTAKSVVDTGSPLFNMPARKFAEKVAGDPKLTQFNVARQVAVQEIGKVLSGAMGNAAISDSARHEVDQLLSPDASLAQIDAAAQILKRDMANRKASMAAELGDIQKRMSGRMGTPGVSAQESPASEPPKRRKWNPATGALE